MSEDASSTTLTFLFADLESSTRLWEEFPEAMKEAMERHDAILRDAVAHANGSVVKITGDGLLAVFRTSSDAVDACLRAQLALQDEAWAETDPLRVRMGVHVGAAQQRAGDFYGPPVNRAARIMAAAHGGQVLLSRLAAELAGERLPRDAVLRDLGEHRLKDLSRPERLFQLVHPRLARDFPPLATLTNRPNNLPTQASAFLGRETQLSAIRDLLDAPGVRLLTLTGPGGIGKTRLGLHAAADQVDRFEDGVYFVDLSSARDATAAFEAILRAVGVSGSKDEGVLDVLKQELRTSHMLLVLDNFEQVVNAADDVADLLQQCGDLKVLVTSREALRVRGEHVLAVPPMSLPDDGAGTQISADRIGEYEAVRLFVERAREGRADFALTEANAAAVAEITARLDGLPLAIELAAARLTVFSPDDLRRRLRSRLELLGRGPRDLPARQRTLRGTIEWSYDLLDREEQAIFKLLSLFSSARIEAVEEVVARVESLEGLDVVDRLTSLVDKSLVRSVESRGSKRLSMLETIREFAAERLAEEPEVRDAATKAHADYFSEFARNGREALYGPQRDATLEDLVADLANLLAAWQYAVDARDLEKLDDLLDSLWVLHEARGSYRAAVELARDLLGVLAAVPSTPELVQDKIALATGLARGLLAIRGYTEEVEAAYGEALSLLEEAGGLPQLFPVLRGLASFYLYRTEFDKGLAAGRQLLDLAEQQGDVSLQVEGHLIVGANLAPLGDVPAALDHLDRAIALFDRDRHVPGRLRLGASPGVVAHTTSAFLLWLSGYPDRSVDRTARGLELARELDHPFTLAYALFHVGFRDLWRREFELVQRSASGALEVAQDHDYEIWEALALVLQGVAMAALGEAEEGLARSDRGIALYQGLKTPPVFWPNLLSVRAQGFAFAGRPEEGIRAVEQAIELYAARVNILYPELVVLKGDLLLATQGADAAERSFRTAFEVAGEVGAHMTRLRAATRLARVSRAFGKRADAMEVLRSVYGTFTEGFETRDLLEARSLLDEAHAQVL